MQPFRRWGGHDRFAFADFVLADQFDQSSDRLAGPRESQSLGCDGTMCRIAAQPFAGPAAALDTGSNGVLQGLTPPRLPATGLPRASQDEWLGWPSAPVFLIAAVRPSTPVRHDQAMDVSGCVFDAWPGEGACRIQSDCTRLQSPAGDEYR